MRNYIIGTLLTVILVLVSYIYTNEKSYISYDFPTPERTKIDNIEVPLFLYVFFSKKNCHDCLEIIDVLNNLPPHFIVEGVVPADELEHEKDIREITKAVFPLTSESEYKKYIPLYTPTIIGVSPKRKVMFVLPGVPGENGYLEDFLESLYAKLFPIFLAEKETKKD